MNSCTPNGKFSGNPKAEISALLCNIPFQWRDAIAEALTCALSQVINVDVTPSCDILKKCETVTQIFTSITDNNVSVKYVNEKNITTISDLDLTEAINNALDEVDPKCLMSQEEWDALTYPERLNAVFAKVCCVHGDCQGNPTSGGCGCVDCEDVENPDECIGLTACPCVTYAVTGTPPFIFSYKDCESKAILEFESVEETEVHICAIRGTIVTPLGVFSNEIANTCEEIPVTTTTSSSTTTTTAAPTTTSTTTTTTSTTSTTTIPPPTTTTTSTTTTTTVLPPPPTTTSTTTTTTTTSTSTTTTTTVVGLRKYYLADEYDCNTCFVTQSNILVDLPSAHAVQLGKFYQSNNDGFVYNIVNSTPQLAGASIALLTGNFTTCGGACT